MGLSVLDFRSFNRKKSSSVPQVFEMNIGEAFMNCCELGLTLWRGFSGRDTRHSFLPAGQKAYFVMEHVSQELHFSARGVNLTVFKCPSVFCNQTPGLTVFLYAIHCCVQVLYFSFS